ncbi:MAG: PQQ-binding-like beta-propeller repeat protein [Verrucomicrobiota bacterium]|jgi:outer membrane protein assembly factor BamB
MTLKNILFPALLAGVCCLPALGADWPQYRGPNHDGTSPEKIPTKWPDSGLTEVWKTPLKNGFSSFTLGGGKVYTLVTRSIEGGDQEVCVALDAGSGKELWATPLGIAKYDGGGDSGAPSNSGGDGSRSTPSYDDGKVYTFNAHLALKCMNASDGKEIWSCDLMREHAGHNVHWESAASPLIEGNLVFVAGGGPGQALLAFDKKNGHVVWKGQDDVMTHATPVAATILGQRQVIFFTTKGLVSVTPATGAVLWRFAVKASGAGGTSPVVEGDVVYCSMCYGVGTAVCKVSKAGDAWTATELWRVPGNANANHWSTPVVVNGYVYGLFDQAKHATGPLKCIELATGQVKWSKSGFGPGGINEVGGNLLVLSDAGELVLVKPTPDAYTELTRAHVLAGKCWNSVAISDGRIYARSTKEGVCLNLSN